MCNRVNFWHRSRLRHYPMGCSTILKEMHLLKEVLTSKRCITPFQGNCLKCLNMCQLKGLTQQCQYQNQFYAFIGCLCVYMFKHILKNYINRQNCLICVPSPKFPHVIPAFCHGYSCFSNGTTCPKHTIKQSKASLQPLKWENWRRVRSRSFILVLFCQPFKKNNNEPEKQKPKKQKKKQETKKTKNTQKKTILHIPRWE